MYEVKTLRPQTANEILHPPVEDLIYALDPYCQNEANRVFSEIWTVSAGRLTQIQNGLDYFIIIPKHGPFFLDNLRLRYRPSQHSELIDLVMGVDYFCNLEYADATRQLSKPVYAGIELVNLTLSGTVILDYHVLGGEYAMDRDYAIKAMIEHSYNPLQITWDYIVNKPFFWKPSEHPLPANDLIGMKDVVIQLERNGNTTAEGFGSVAKEIRVIGESFNMEKFNQAIVAMDNNTFITMLNKQRAMEHRVAYLEQIIANHINKPSH